MFRNLHSRSVLIVVAISCFAVGAAFSYASLHYVNTASTNAAPLRDTSGTFTYIAPLLLCSYGQNESFEEFAPLKKKLDAVTTDAHKNGTITSSSVYFRDLNTGSWMGINENDEYTPASLLKVPILIAYFKAAEKNPALLQERAPYSQLSGQAPPLVTHPILANGKSYSVLDLIRGMIIDSDNTAKIMLEGGLDKRYLSEVYSELGIENPYKTGGDYRISTRTYALFFRILYNGTFLNHDKSEEALSMMSKVVFDKGLRAGTPSDITIAHKYGYAVIQKDPSVIELSDCGIIYKPEKPYILCVMARGADPETVSTYIRDVAAKTYEMVSN